MLPRLLISVILALFLLMAVLVSYESTIFISKMMNVMIVVTAILAICLSFTIFYSDVPGRPLTIKQLKKYHNYATESVSQPVEVLNEEGSKCKRYLALLFDGSGYVSAFFYYGPPPSVFSIDYHNDIIKVQIKEKEVTVT